MRKKEVFRPKTNNNSFVIGKTLNLLQSNLSTKVTFRTQL